MDALSLTTTSSPDARAPAQDAARHATDLYVEQVEFGYYYVQQVEFGQYLRGICARHASARRGGPVLACTTADAVLPVEVALRLGLVVDELITNAFRHGFPNGRDGKINVGFKAGPDAWQLTVEDTGIGLWHGRGCGRHGAGLDVARRQMGELGGRLELPEVFGGTRCVATAPRDLALQPCRTTGAAGVNLADPA